MSLVCEVCCDSSAHTENEARLRGMKKGLFNVDNYGDGVIELGNRCALKLEKAPPKRCSLDFFHAICLRSCSMARTALKHKHMASKLNSAVKMIEKSLRNDYLLKKLFVAHFFSIIAH